MIQRNAIESWLHLRPRCEVLVFGGEHGTADIAKELGVGHVPQIALNQFGTPLLNGLFDTAQRISKNDMLCYINSDIVLCSDFVEAVKKVMQKKKCFLLVGQCWNLNIAEALEFNEETWEQRLIELVRQSGKMRGPLAIDYFVFPRGLFRDFPPFAVGRAGFDRWLIWKARNVGATVVDVTAVVMAVHQNHDYSHVPGGKAWSYDGEEAKRNYQLAGRLGRRYSISEATHRLKPLGLKTYLPGYFLFHLLWGKVNSVISRFNTAIRIRSGI